MALKICFSFSKVIFATMSSMKEYALYGELYERLKMTTNNWNRVMTWVNIVFHEVLSIGSLLTCQHPHLNSVLQDGALYNIQFRMSSCNCRIIIEAPTEGMLLVYL